MYIFDRLLSVLFSSPLKFHQCIEYLISSFSFFIATLVSTEKFMCLCTSLAAWHHTGAYMEESSAAGALQQLLGALLHGVVGVRGSR